MKKFMYGIIAIAITLGFTGCEKAKPYPQTVKSWKSYKDVANYMQSNFRFDTSRQNEFRREFNKYKNQNSDNLYDFTIAELSLKPNETYNRGGGFCGDAETLVKDALNKINPKYNAKTIFIDNQYGPPHHWVTGFYINNKLDGKYELFYNNGKSSYRCFYKNGEMDGKLTEWSVNGTVTRICHIKNSKLEEWMEY